MRLVISSSKRFCYGNDVIVAMVTSTAKVTSTSVPFQSLFLGQIIKNFSCCLRDVYFNNDKDLRDQDISLHTRMLLVCSFGSYEVFMLLFFSVRS